MPTRSFSNQLKSIQKSFSIYWEAYGGRASLIQSPYLYAALVVSILSLPLLRNESETAWFSVSLSALPNLLGFTLGGYAILLALGNDQFQSAISGRDEDDEISGFMMINATFVHFIIVQIVAILLALIGSAWGAKTGIFAFAGLLTFTYSIMTAVAAAMSILRLSNLYDSWRTHQLRMKNQQQQDISKKS